MDEEFRHKCAELTSQALRKAFLLGQTYWQQADSESFRQQDKSEVTRQQYLALVDETAAKILSGIPEE